MKWCDYSNAASISFRIPSSAGSHLTENKVSLVSHAAASCSFRCRDVMAQFSFLMVLIPILGEQFLDLLDVFTGEAVFGAGAGSLSLLIGFVSAFLSGLFACRAMVALVRRAKLSWFALYCLVAAVLIFIIA